MKKSAQRRRKHCALAVVRLYPYRNAPWKCHGNVPWVFHGFLPIWNHHGLSMEYPWCTLHGHSMDNPWWFHMGKNPWKTHGNTMVSTHGYSMEYPWCRHHGITMALPWVFHGSTMVILWCLHHGYSMVISYGQKPMENSWNLVSLVP